MITLKADNSDILKIQSELNLKVGGIKEMSNSKILEELSNAVFTLSAQSFIKAMNLEAKGNPKTYHHIYEWNQVGLSKGRLFRLYKVNSANGKLIIKPGFVNSRSAVPINKELLVPGRTGKTVASKHVFRNKSSIMEAGRPIIFRTSKPTPIPADGKLNFVAAGTVIKNYNPGGKNVKGSFERFYTNWFATKVNSVINASGIMEKIDDEIAQVLNKKGAGPTQVRTAIINLLRQYSKGVDVV